MLRLPSSSVGAIARAAAPRTRVIQQQRRALADTKIPSSQSIKPTLKNSKSPVLPGGANAAAPPSAAPAKAASAASPPLKNPTPLSPASSTSATPTQVPLAPPSPPKIQTSPPQSSASASPKVTTPPPPPPPPPPPSPPPPQLQTSSTAPRKSPSMSVLQTAADITVLINSDVSSSERRINPSWSISTLKSKLLPITAIPPGSQQLTLRLPHVPQPIAITAEDEDATTLAGWPLQAFAEIHVTDLRPPSARLNLTDVSEITKWEMPVEQYEKRSDSVRAWKERNQLGRFDPSKQSQSEAGKAAAHEKLWREAKARGIEAGKRCRVGGEDGRRGTVRYVGEVDEIPAGGIWVGVEGDEPTGKNDGSIQGKSYFSCKPKHGSFVRPDRVEIGDFPEVNDLELEELEEM